MRKEREEGNMYKKEENKVFKKYFLCARVEEQNAFAIIVFTNVHLCDEEHVRK